MYVLLTIIIGYLFGCLHGSQILEKLTHVNIKQSGSKNPGASNATVLLGWRYGAVVAFVDILKAILSFSIVTFMLHYYHIGIEEGILLIYANAFFVIIGHNYPITMNFKGGKGTASFLGFLLCIDWKFTAIAFMIFLFVAFMTQYFVLGTFMAYISFVFYTFILFGKAPSFIALLFMVLFLLRHTENYKRIMNKEEMKISTMFQREIS